MSRIGLKTIEVPDSVTVTKCRQLAEVETDCMTKVF